MKKNNFNILKKIGNTPIIELKNIKKIHKLNVDIYAKVELFNPFGSIKDRVAYYMLNNSKESILKNNSTVIVPTSGNLGISIAAISAIKKYRSVVVMPDNMSLERISLIKAYGSETILTPSIFKMDGSIKKAAEIARKTGGIILNQFTDISNVKAHYNTTAREIFRDLNEHPDYLIAGVGTGGTISGIGKFVKDKKINTKIIAVEPFNSAVISGGTADIHKIQGIGAGFIPPILDLSLIDCVVKVSDEEAYETTRLIAKTESLAVGISSGAVLAAAIKISKKNNIKEKKIVVIFPDGGEKYLSTGIFN